MITALGHSSIAASFAGPVTEILSVHTAEPHDVVEGQSTLVAAERFESRRVLSRSVARQLPKMHIGKGRRRLLIQVDKGIVG